jgi:hypothetical protein
MIHRLFISLRLARLITANRYLFIGLMFLSACQGPLALEEMREKGIGSSHALSQAPERAATCLARNVQNRWALFTANILHLANQTGFEVMVRNGAGHLMSITHVTPRDRCSDAFVWISPRSLDVPDEFLLTALKDC